MVIHTTSSTWWHAWIPAAPASEARGLTSTARQSRIAARAFLDPATAARRDRSPHPYPRSVAQDRPRSLAAWTVRATPVLRARESGRGGGDDRLGGGLARPGARGAGQRQAQDASPDVRGLAGQRAGRVREAEPLAQGADPRGELRIPIAGQVGKEVVLDLVAEVATEEVERRRSADVRGAEQLPQVPFPSALALDLLLGEGRGAVGKMAGETPDSSPTSPSASSKTNSITKKARFPRLDLLVRDLKPDPAARSTAAGAQGRRPPGRSERPANRVRRGRGSDHAIEVDRHVGERDGVVLVDGCEQAPLMAAPLREPRGVQRAVAVTL